MAKIKKNIADYGMPEFFKAFKDKYPKGECPVDANLFRKITADYWDQIGDAMIYDNYEVKFPIKFGYLKIVKEKRKTKFYKDKAINLLVDWGATNKLWKENPEAAKAKRLMYNINEHTDGYMIKFWWDRRTSTVKNLSAYCFKMNRTKARKLATAIKGGDSNIDYYEKPKINPFRK